MLISRLQQEGNEFGRTPQKSTHRAEDGKITLRALWQEFIQNRERSEKSHQVCSREAVPRHQVHRM